jgi:hypothetical protein
MIGTVITIPPLPTCHNGPVSPYISSLHIVPQVKVVFPGRCLGLMPTKPGSSFFLSRNRIDAFNKILRID